MTKIVEKSKKHKLRAIAEKEGNCRVNQGDSTKSCRKTQEKTKVWANSRKTHDTMEIKTPVQIANR